MSDPIGVVAYAERRGVGRCTVYKWISQGKLRGAALPAPGLIDPTVADLQMPVRPVRAPVEAADDPRVRAMSDLAVAMEMTFFPAAITALRLQPSQCEQLGRCWLRWRRRQAGT